MKKLIILLILCLGLVGCTNSNNANGKWDCVEYQNIEEMNKAAGTNLVKAEMEGIQDEWFGVISQSIAQYTFKNGEEEWTLRASKDVENDISGLNYENFTFEKDITATYYNDDFYAYRFFFEDTQYVFSVKVKDKDIARSYFDKVCGELQTSITGIKSGYENDIYIEGDNVIYRIVMYNDDGSKIIMEVIYAFKDDKMVSITNNNIFDTPKAAKEYYDMLIENGASADNMTLSDNVITYYSNDNIDFYIDYTKESFFEEMKSSLAQ